MDNPWLRLLSWQEAVVLSHHPRIPLAWHTRVRLLRVTYPPHPVALRLAHSQSPPPQQQQQHTGRHTYQHQQLTTTP